MDRMAVRETYEEGLRNPDPNSMGGMLKAILDELRWQRKRLEAEPRKSPENISPWPDAPATSSGEKPTRPQVGARVRIEHTEEDGHVWVEYAIVVATWFDRTLLDWDCYVAVVGSGGPPPNTDFRPDAEAYREHAPEGVSEKPYVVRYLRTTIKEGW